MSKNKIDQSFFRSSFHFIKEKHSKILESDEIGLTITEINHSCYLNLRGRSDDTALVEGVKRVLNIELPVRPGTFSSNDTASIFWLSPDEWLISSNLPADTLKLELTEALQGHIAVTDVSGGQAKIRLEGPSLLSVLQKASGYDFEAWLFENTYQNRCVQTNFAKATALVAHNTDGTFDLVIRRSFADYIAKWLLDAGRETGCLIQQ
jgi:sarcosine oxidase subunit gamma